VQNLPRSELDDDARLDDAASAVDEYRHPLERPQCCVLGRRLLISGREHAELERDRVLVERSQDLSDSTKKRDAHRAS